MAEATTPMKTLREILPDKPVLVTLPGSATVLEAAERMTAERVGAILVVDGDGQPSGMFTERDLMCRVLHASASLNAPVANVMTRDPVVGRTDESIACVLARMHIGGFRHLPVLDAEDRPVGTISVKRAVHFLGDSLPETIYNLANGPEQYPAAREGG